jgi:hypothetical protein
MNQKGIRALPRDVQLLGRAIDSRETWNRFGLLPIMTLYNEENDLNSNYPKSLSAAKPYQNKWAKLRAFGFKMGVVVIFLIGFYIYSVNRK